MLKDNNRIAIESYIVRLRITYLFPVFFLFWSQQAKLCEGKAKASQIRFMLLAGLLRPKSHTLRELQVFAAEDVAAAFAAPSPASPEALHSLALGALESDFAHSHLFETTAEYDLDLWHAHYYRGTHCYMVSGNTYTKGAFAPDQLHYARRTSARIPSKLHDTSRKQCVF